MISLVAHLLFLDDEERLDVYAFVIIKISGRVRSVANEKSKQRSP